MGLRPHPGVFVFEYFFMALLLHPGWSVRECARERGREGREGEQGERLCARACVHVCALWLHVCVFALRAREGESAYESARDTRSRGTRVHLCPATSPSFLSPALSCSATPTPFPPASVSYLSPHNNLLVLRSPSCLLPLASCLRALTSLLSATVVLAYVCVIELLFLNLIF